MNIRQYIRELRSQEQTELGIAKLRAESKTWDLAEKESNEICPECNRASTFTAKYLRPSIQMRMFETEGAWLECDLCGAKLDAEDILYRDERKPAGKLEPDSEKQRRRA